MGTFHCQLPAPEMVFHTKVLEPFKCGLGPPPAGQSERWTSGTLSMLRSHGQNLSPSLAMHTRPRLVSTPACTLQVSLLLCSKSCHIYPQGRCCVVVAITGHSFSEPSSFHVPAKIHHQLLRKALSDQQSIGCHQVLFKGYLSRERRHIADRQRRRVRAQYLPYRLRPSSCSGSLKIFIQFCWLLRLSTVLHGANTLRNMRDAELAELRDLHAHPELLPAADRRY